MWTLKTITICKDILANGEIPIGHLSQYGELLSFSLKLYTTQNAVVDLYKDDIKIINNKIIFNIHDFPVKLIAGDELLINLSIDIDIFLKIYAIPLGQVAEYLISPDPKERLLAQFRMRKSKEDSDFWQKFLDLEKDSNVDKKQNNNN